MIAFSHSYLMKAISNHRRQMGFGGTISPALPILLVEAAVDTACRAADRIKVRKANLTIGRVKARLRRLMEQTL